jgi:hypothetical protein
MSSRYLLFGALAALAFPGAASAQRVAVRTEQLPCVPLSANAAVGATVEGATAGATVRLYFRRLNNLVEDFYYVEMRPGGGTEWWGVLPRPEDHLLPEKEIAARSGQQPAENPWASWWKAKEGSEHRDPNDDLDDEVIRERAAVGKGEKRSWMTTESDDRLEDWLRRLENEPAEYYAAVYDSYGKPVARSDMRTAPITGDCRVSLTPAQVGTALNLTVGETAPWQIGEPLFHWQCEGVVTRIDDRGVLRSDEICRACVVAWEMKNEFLVPAIGVLGTTVVVVGDEPPVSPIRPTT